MLNISDFYKMKESQVPISMITAYDYSSAQICEKSQVDIILVGDSLGMVVYGHPDTLNVTMDDMIRHSSAVRKGALDTFIITDLPYMSYHLDIKTTKYNASQLLIKGLADAVKLEGGSSSRLDAVKAIVDCEIPVVGHLGLTPQSIHKFGGFKVQGKQQWEKDEIYLQAQKLQETGIFMLVLEGIPEELGRLISENLKIPIIGIGAGRYTDGQVLVWHDVLGLSNITAKFSKKWVNGTDIFTESVMSYKNDVKNKVFPGEENVYFPIHK